MNNNYRLQLLSHPEIFATRDEALEYIEDNFTGNALWSEPALFFYGTEREPNMILAVGATKNSSRPRICTIDDTELRRLIEESSQGSGQIEKNTEWIFDIIRSAGLTYDENKIRNQITYEPDSTDELIGNAESIANAISIISSYVQENFKKGELEVDDSNSIDLTLETTGEGNVLSADVKISKEGEDDDLYFNNNVIGVKEDGIFASVNIEYDEELKRLIFTTSGYKNGRFVTDANKKIIDFGEHTIYTASNEGHNINIQIDQDAKTISADAKLSSDESIKNGADGLKANIDITVDSVSNKLTLYVGNNEKVIQLPGISILEDITYDKANKVIIITWKDGAQQTIIPVGDMLKTWVVQNSQTSPVVLTKSEPVASDEPDVLSADLKIAPADNLIDKDSFGQVIVRKSLIDAQINEESIQRQNADATLTNNLNELARTTSQQIQLEINNRHSEDDAIRQSIVSLRDELEGDIDTAKEEIYQRITVDEERINQALIEISEAKAETQVVDTKLTAEIERAQTAESVLNNAITSETERAMAKEDELAQQIAEIPTDISELTETVRQNTSDIAANTTAINKEISDRIEADEELATDIDNLSGRLNVEITRSTNKDEELTASIATANQAVTNEVARAIGAENTLSERITANANQITQINDSLNDRLTHVLNDAKDYTDALASEVTLNVQSINREIESVDSSSKERDIANLETSKAYTDSKIAEISSSSSTDIETAKQEAIDTASADASEKATAALNTAKEYTDAETLRATTAEQTLANSISELTSKDEEIETELANKIESVVIEKASSEDELNYNVYVDGTKVGEINIPKDQFLEDVSYDSTNKEITFVFVTREGSKITKVNIADLVDTYTAGNGLKLTENRFSVKIDSASESYLSVSEEGIKLTGIDSALNGKADASDVYTKDEADAKFLTEHQDISNLATRNYVDGITEEVSQIEARVANNEQSLETINGNEAVEGSIKKALKDAKEYAKSYTDAETERAQTAEQTNANAISVINGNEAVEGSIKKALKDAKEYSDARLESESATINQSINNITNTLATKANVSDVYTKAEIDAKGYLTNANIVSLATKAELEEESNRAKAAEHENADNILLVKDTADTNKLDIEQLQSDVQRLNMTSVESDSISINLNKESDGTEITASLTLDTEKANIIKIGGNGVYAEVEMSYDLATNTITFNNGITTKTFVLSDHSLVVGGVYDSAEKAIKLTVQTAEGTDIISIPVGDLIHTLRVENTVANPVKLDLTQGQDGIDVLSSHIDISTKEDNGLLRDNGTLYVSKNADSLTGYWGDEKKSLQSIINSLKAETDKVDGIESDVDTLKSDMNQAKYDIVNLKAEDTIIKNTLTTHGEKIAVLENRVDTLDGEYNDVNARLTTVENRLSTAETNIESNTQRISTLEQNVSQIRSELDVAKSQINDILAEIGGTGSEHTILERLATIENIVNNLIDFSDVDGDGSPDGF